VIKSLAKFFMSSGHYAASAFSEVNSWWEIIPAQAIVFVSVMIVFTAIQASHGGRSAKMDANWDRGLFMQIKNSWNSMKSERQMVIMDMVTKKVHDYVKLSSIEDASASVENEYNDKLDDLMEDEDYHKVTSKKLRTDSKDDEQPPGSNDIPGDQEKNVGNPEAGPDNNVGDPTTAANEDVDDGDGENTLDDNNAPRPTKRGSDQEAQSEIRKKAKVAKGVDDIRNSLSVHYYDQENERLEVEITEATTWDSFTAKVEATPESVLWWVSCRQWQTFKKEVNGCPLSTTEELQSMLKKALENDWYAVVVFDDPSQWEEPGESA